MKTLILNSIQLQPGGYGHFKVIFHSECDQSFSAITSNMTTIDNLDEDDEDSSKESIKHLLSLIYLGEYDEVRFKGYWKNLRLNFLIK